MDCGKSEADHGALEARVDFGADSCSERKTCFADARHNSPVTKAGSALHHNLCLCLQMLETTLL